MSFQVSKLYVYLFIVLIFWLPKLTVSESNRNGKKSNFSFFITGGYRPNVHILAKYIVSIRGSHYKKYFGDDHFCAGTIISPTVIVTAAHCLVDRNYMKTVHTSVRVAAGSPRRLIEEDTQMFKVSKVIIHPKYSEKTKKHDIGMLVLDSEVPEDNTNIQRIGLPEGDPEPLSTCTVFGWGRMLNEGPIAAELIYADLVVWPGEKCRKVFDDFGNGIICAGDPKDYEKDACVGDSGGPLVSNEKLIGIVSFGIGCGTPGFPGVYTNVFYYRDWIMQNAVDKLRESLKLCLALTVLIIALF